MKLFKKSMTALVVTSMIAMVGCGDNGMSDKYNENVHLLTDVEKAYLKTYFDKGYSVRGYDDTLSKLPLVRQSIDASKTKAGYAEIPKDKPPFCSVLTSLIREEASNHNGDPRKSVVEGDSLSQTWLEINGVSLIDSCGGIQLPIDLPKITLKEKEDQEAIERMKLGMPSSTEEVPEEVVHATVDEAPVVNEDVKVDVIVATEQEKQVIASTVTTEDKGTRLSHDLIDELTEAVGECRSAQVKLITTMDANQYLTISDYDTVNDLITDCKMDKLRHKLNQ